jgi:hypothetical protein
MSYCVTARGSLLRGFALPVLAITLSVLAYRQADSARRRILESFTVPTGHRNSSTPAADQKALESMASQRSTYSTWAGALLGFMTATIMTVGVPWFRRARVLYVLLGPGAVYSLESLIVGSAFDGRMTYLQAKGGVEEDFDTLIKLLSLQARDVLWGGACVVLFVASFVVAILLGLAKPGKS